MNKGFATVSIVILTVTMLSSFIVFADESSHRKLASRFLEHLGYNHAIFMPQRQSRHLADEVMYYYPCKDKEIVSKKLDTFLGNRYRNIEIRNQFIDLFVAVFTEEDLENLLEFIDLTPKEPKVFTQLMDLTWEKFANSVEGEPKWFFEYSPKDPEILMEFKKTIAGEKANIELPNVLLKSRELRSNYLKTLPTQNEMGMFVQAFLNSNGRCKK